MSDEIQIQVRCPKDESYQVVGLGKCAKGRTCVAWCSRELDCPHCDMACLEQLKTVAYIMLTEFPRFQLSELDLLSIEDVLDRFEAAKFDKLPVIDQDRLVGSISLRRIAYWKDNRESRSDLCMNEWTQCPLGKSLLECIEPENTLLSPTSSLGEATESLLKAHQNELFVIEPDGEVVGIIYARQVLRVIQSDQERSDQARSLS